MARNNQFQYELEPILLTRQWALDALLLELRTLNEKISAKQQLANDIRARMTQAANDWNAFATSDQSMSVNRLTVLTNYMGDMGQREKRVNDELLRLMDERDALIDRVVSAQRGLDAVKDHREQMHDKFVQVRMSGEFKAADDQWNTLQSRVAHHDD